MKAVQMREPGGPEVLKLVERPMPTPGPGEVLVKIHAIGVSYADTLVRSGTHLWMPQMPYVPGNEATGHVVDANGSSRLKNGQPVFFTSWDIGFAGGLYAEYIVVREQAPWLLPEGVDLDDAATLFNYLVGWILLHNGARGAETGTVFLHGAAGGMGTTLAELCRLAGSTVIGAAGGEPKCTFLRERGVAHAIDSRTDSVVERVLEITEGRGADIIFNHVAGNTFVQDMKMLAPLGLIVSYAALEGMPDRDLFTDMRAHIDRSPAIRVIATHVFGKTPKVLHEACAAVIDLLAERQISPAIQARLPLAQAGEAHRMLESRESMGKILLKP
ncbi:alcohol dehydrogenase [Variovorax sp. WS11]|uniref:quinone oxidoreductase family protein n=1 Tax=Variovorax sp. WS11 TaxID=1105204 RepID=UPI000D0CE9FC|nr:zinc-binding dehydrogenase [Variovorax sp. WS11]NDZ17340.1 zinc-binding dehydrogenase [Variovorax sp. WS11]PSL86120.1 alcohol dehydrogenase [Variovorax sp. WS11]